VAKACHIRRRSRRQAPPLGPPSITRLEHSDLELTDERWEAILLLLPPQKPQIGRPNQDHRPLVAGMLWIARTGSPWRNLPEEFGPWETVYTRYNRWKNAGIWQRILDTFKQEDASPVN
jgi:transposase